MTNRDSSETDLGTSTDRAMFDDEGESRMPERPRERGSGRSGEENPGSSGGGITNRGRERERHEQEKLPERGTSQSDR